MTILEESQVSIHTIAEHIQQSGLDIVNQDFDEEQPWIRLVTEMGLNFRIHVEEERKFLRFSTFLPLDKSKPCESKLRFVRECNFNLFLAGFTLDRDDDLFIVYYMSFTQGLILAQFMKVVQRFSELLEHIVNEKNGDEIIKFPDHDDRDADENSNTSHGIFVPSNVLLN